MSEYPQCSHLINSVAKENATRIGMKCGWLCKSAISKNESICVRFALTDTLMKSQRKNAKTIAAFMIVLHNKYPSGQYSNHNKFEFLISDNANSSR